MTGELILRLFAAALMGGAIGLEREYRAKEAGLRTHFLVALGSALFMVISQFGFEQILDMHPLLNARLDPSRIAAQVVSGIGFIGAGIIIFQKHVVKGLTTAAGMWVTAAIGMTCGAGMYELAVASTVMVLICLEALNILLQKFGTRAISITFSSPDVDFIRQVLDRFRKEGMTFDSYNMREVQKGDDTFYSASIEVKVKRSQYEKRILRIMEELDGVKIESIE